jgi:carbamoyl-phosphate synthase large subunit
VIEKQQVDAVFPQPDSEVGIVSKERAKIRASLFLPDESTVTICLDKFQALTRWSEAGLREKPEILSLKDKVPEETWRRLGYPCWIRAREGAGGLLSCQAPNATIAKYWVKFHWEQGIETDFVAEQYLPGRDYCFMSIWDHGNLVTSMIRERLSWVGHRLIGSGGTSRLNHVVHSDIVNTQSLRAINAITSSPHGVFCVDLKEDSEGTPCPTEINCRFTTNVHYLALASIQLGHPEWNFPWLAVQLATKDAIPRCLKTNALPADLWFTKNTDMGFTMARGDHWKAIEARATAKR